VSAGRLNREEEREGGTVTYGLLIASWFFAAIFGLATASFFLMGLAPQAADDAGRVDPRREG
jgi:hypothetical protein